MAYVPYFSPLIFLCAKNASRLDTIKKNQSIKGGQHVCFRSSLRRSENPILTPILPIHTILSCNFQIMIKRDNQEHMKLYKKK